MGTTHCPRCAAPGVVSITLTMNGGDVALGSCNRCDSRWWNRDGEAVELANVLALVDRRKAKAAV